MKESHFKEVETTKMVKMKENALDVDIQIISSESVQSRQETIIKELSLEERGVIVVKMRKKRIKTKLSCTQASYEKCLGINLDPDEWIK
ncbi:hypothetical protein Tco_1482373 [Tanacetum coccineum]